MRPGVATAPSQADFYRAVLEGRMNTQQARYDGAPYRLRADMALMRGDFAKRETRMLLAITGMPGLSVAVLGFIPG